VDAVEAVVEVAAATAGVAAETVRGKDKGKSKEQISQADTVCSDVWFANFLHGRGRRMVLIHYCSSVP
jgi:hypothetical protein